jgi:hypothetical protein
VRKKNVERKGGHVKPTKDLREKWEGKIVDLVSVPHTLHFDPELLGRESSLGAIWHYQNEIQLEYSLKPRDLLTTLLHEFLESINKRYDLRLPHQKIQTLEAGLFQVMMSNPDIFQEFVNEARYTYEKKKSGKNGKKKEVGCMVKRRASTCRREVRMVPGNKVRTGTPRHRQKV